MNQREEKRAKFQPEKKRGFFPLIAVAVAVLAAVGAVFWNFNRAEAGKYPTVAAENGTVSIPAALLDDGQAHFFSYRSGATPVDFFVLKSRDGVVRAALDTCDVCYREKKGYRQEGDEMICNNCDQRFRSDLINEVRGGCNPAPIDRVVVNGRIVIAAAELERGKRYFEPQPK